MATVTTEPVRLPPALRLPKIVQGIAFLISHSAVVPALGRRYGSEYTLNLPIFGQTVVISDPALVKDVFSTSSDLLERPTQLGSVFGPGSTFSLNGGEHLERRRLILPPFHGNRVRTYEHIVEEEVMREIETWPEGREFETLPAMTSITLNTILRAVLGAEAAVLEELRVLLPRAVTLGSRLVTMPKLRHDLGPWSPWGRVMQYRRRYCITRPHGLHGPKSCRSFGIVTRREPSVTARGSRTRSSSSTAASAPNTARRIVLRVILVIAGSVSNSRPSGQVSISRITSSSTMCS